jgi:aryl-alcohol dehydrogenase-like predicted oxidoreductase
MSGDYDLWPSKYETDGHQQIDYALERGVNFIDTAEMYPVPQKLLDMAIQKELLVLGLKKVKNEILSF